MRKILAVLALLVAPGAAWAAQPPAPPPSNAKELDTLFAALAKAQGPEDAQPIEDQILALFQHSQSPSIDLLMTRAAAALNAGDNGTARKLYDSITAIAPNYAEAWFQKAQLQAASGNDGDALISLQTAVTLNPRHFAALAELGSMLDDYGDKPGALKALRQALALDPNFDGLARHVRELTKAVEGERI
jgi:tetratricopeptide (TPR) repeat protein